MSRLPNPRLLVAGVAAVLLSACTSVESAFAPEPDLWERWAAHEPSSTATIDHGAWDRLLRSYLSRDEDGVNRFAYAEISAADRRALETYIAELSAAPISRYRRAEQFAYWVNLYNAATVRVVLAHYPVDTIRDIDISPGVIADGPWGRKLVTVEGEALSLDDIEHRILRPIWRDPRIHYAVNCAAVGCPNLQPRAFTAENSEVLLTAGAEGYVNDPRGARLADGGLVVSSIYAWFEEDFGGDASGVLAHLRLFARPGLSRQLDRGGRITGYEYDWSLNDAVAR